MSRSLFEESTKDALTSAVVAVERNSSAEVVVAMRGRSGRYLHADLLAGSAAAAVTLLFLLFSPWTFALVWFVIDPLVVGLLVGLAVSRLASVRRVLTPGSWQREWVEAQARATFLERGIHQTRGRTGILVYVSALERMAALVPDTGVEQAVPEDLWRAAAKAVDEAVASGGAQVAEQIAAMGQMLAEALPVSEDDVNELPDEVQA